MSPWLFVNLLGQAYILLLREEAQLFYASGHIPACSLERAGARRFSNSGCEGDTGILVPEK